MSKTDTQPPLLIIICKKKNKWMMFRYEICSLDTFTKIQACFDTVTKSSGVKVLRYKSAQL